MKLKNETIKEIQKVLTTVGNKEINDWQLAFKIANNNYKLMRAAEPVVKVENDILRRYGEKDENGELITSSDGRVKIIDTKKYGQDIIKL